MLRPMSNLIPKDKDPHRDEYRRWAFSRYAEATALHRAVPAEGALYLAGLALELAFKAAACKHLDVEWLPRVLWTHDLEALLVYAGLSNQLEQDARLSSEFAFINTHWADSLVRYGHGIEAARVDAVFSKLEDGAGGGLWPWIIAKS